MGLGLGLGLVLGFSTTANGSHPFSSSRASCQKDQKPGTAVLPPPAADNLHHLPRTPESKLPDSPVLASFELPSDSVANACAQIVEPNVISTWKLQFQTCVPNQRDCFKKRRQCGKGTCSFANVDEDFMSVAHNDRNGNQSCFATIN